MTDYVLNAVVKIERKHERVVSWMYPDSKQNVTVAMGHLLRTAADAMKLRFYHWRGEIDHEDNGSEANIIEIRNAWETVKQSNRPYTLLRMNDEDMAELGIADIRAAEAVMVRQFPEVESYPAQAIIALLDMTFNMGSIDPAKWIHFTPAVRARDWKSAAVHCIRQDIGAVGPTDKRWIGSRNYDTEQLFVQAAEAQARQQA